MVFFQKEFIIPALIVGALVILAVFMPKKDVGSGSSEIKEVCQKGVMYYQSGSGLALAVNIAGRPFRCE